MKDHKEQNGTVPKHQKIISWSGYLLALRPWSFSASMMPVLLGALLCWKTTGFFDVAILVLTAVSVLGVHAAGNLVNTYYDYMKGVDSKVSDDRTLVDHILTPEQVVRLGGFLYTIGAVSLVFLVALSPAKMEHLALLFFGGLSGSFMYTGGIGLKYYALGDVVILITFGPLSVLFSYLVQCGQFQAYSLLYALPLALHTEAILHSNNTRDIKTDKKAGAITLATLIGPQISYAIYCVLLFTPYIISMVLSVNVSQRFLIPYLTIGLAFQLERDFRNRKLQTLPKKTAKLNLFFALLYLLSCGISPRLPGLTRT